MKIRKIDGNLCEVVKVGRAKYVRSLSKEEVNEVYAYRASVVLVPVLMFVVFVFAGRYL